MIFVKRPRAAAAGELEPDRERSVSKGMHAASAGFVTYALLLDTHKRVKGYKLAWHMAGAHHETTAFERLRALLSNVATHLNHPKTGWRLGRLALYFDMTIEGLALDELQALPPANVVLCMGLEDLTDAHVRSTLLDLGRQGFRFMVCGTAALPEDIELCAIITHVDVDDGHPELVAAIRREQPLGLPGVQPVATRMATWKDFDACAVQGVDVFVRGRQSTMPPMEAAAGLRAESMVIVRLMQSIRCNDDLRTIEEAFVPDAALTHRLLRHINSPGVGMGHQVQAIRQALAIYGCSPLLRWLSVLLATSHNGSAAFMMKKAIIRGPFVELMGQGIAPPGEADNLFLAGMFSLADRLLGVSLEEVLDKVELCDSVRLAVLKREGVYGPLIALAESCDIDATEAARWSESLFMSAEKVNTAHLCALAWAHDVAHAQSAC